MAKQRAGATLEDPIGGYPPFHGCGLNQPGESVDGLTTCTWRVAKWSNDGASGHSEIQYCV
jgi:hypothetical protein